VELRHALEAFSNPSLGQHRARLVQNADVVVRFRPIDADEDLQTAPPLELVIEPEETRVDLIVQCSPGTSSH